MATIRIVLSLSGEKQKSHNPVHMKTKSFSLVLIALLAYFLASPSSQAVSPPPDGGYGDSTGGGNTAIGTGALLKIPRAILTRRWAFQPAPTLPPTPTLSVPVAKVQT
jgi:hypothetical protein